MSLFSVRKEDDYLSKQYDAGRAAALKGMGHWENPHVMGTSSSASSMHWYAGWCSGKSTIILTRWRECIMTNEAYQLKLRQKLKPCPFCGSLNLFIDSCHVTCLYCKSHGPFLWTTTSNINVRRDLVKQHIANWNKRSTIEVEK